MKVVSVIAEYNPFHNGHLHQINQIRERYGRDCAIISIMSGNFVQRGGPAILDKWTRTETAIASGIDLIIESPVVYATGSAEVFAYGGVAAARAAGICSHLVFGSESGELRPLEMIADLLNDEPEEYRNFLKTHLDEGMSYPVARSLALYEFTSDPTIRDTISSPNNILAVEYLKAIRKLNCENLTPFTFKREGAEYNDDDYDPDIHPSASAIRRIFASDDLTSADLMRSLHTAMPSSSLSLLTDSYRKGNCIRSTGSFSSEIITRLLASCGPELSAYAGMIEGLENRLIGLVRSGSLNGSDVEELVRAGSTRRYPGSTVRRALFSMLLGITSEDRKIASLPVAPYYLRVLGFNKKGRYLLKLMRKTAKCPVITRCSDFREFPANEENRNLLRVASLDIAATDIWSQKTSGQCGRDFSTPPISFPR
ncbi:MAG: nucleotidyltransferase family protein [Eubacteriales bacterium]|nr:nucleotidyltransferase family protein [Eubacteriales bacterium]